MGVSRRYIPTVLPVFIYLLWVNVQELRDNLSRSGISVIIANHSGVSIKCQDLNLSSLIRRFDAAKPLSHGHSNQSRVSVSSCQLVEYVTTHAA
jgi:hypothetical protein